MAKKVEYLKNGIFYNMDKEPFLTTQGEWLMDFDFKQQRIIRKTVESNFPVQTIAYKDVSADNMEAFYNFFVKKYASCSCNSINDYTEYSLFNYWTLSHIDASPIKLMICLNFLEYDNLATIIKDIKNCPVQVLQLIPEARKYMLNDFVFRGFIKDVNAGKPYEYLRDKVDKAYKKWLKIPSL